ncbi:MAG: diaminopimelate epimerase [Fimbriimonadales bacterium]|nr:diaminopimelate epimerase [Fimbriimonadales bacterium]
MSAVRRALPFWKVEGVGNDFVLIEAEAVPNDDLSQLAQRLCHRPQGIGSDGLLVVGKGVHAPVAMRMFNPDGTEDFCGNGLRCVARFAYEQGYVQTPEIAIETLSGIIPVQLTLHEGQVAAITTYLPPPRFHPREIPAQVEGEVMQDSPLMVSGHELRLWAVNTGTTHSAIFTDRLPDDETFRRLSPRIETHPLFPERTSVLWAVIESPHRVHVRIWERGVGETQGCGTGAAAVAVLGRAAGWLQNPVEVRSQGGTLMVHWEPGSAIALTGPAYVRFQGTYWLDS